MTGLPQDLTVNVNKSFSFSGDRQSMEGIGLEIKE